MPSAAARRSTILTTDTPGITTLSGNVTTTQFKHFDDAVDLGRRRDADQQRRHAKPSTWPAPSTGRNNLTVDASGINTFEGALGGTTP